LPGDFSGRYSFKDFIPRILKTHAIDGGFNIRKIPRAICSASLCSMDGTPWPPARDGRRNGACRNAMAMAHDRGTMAKPHTLCHDASERWTAGQSPWGMSPAGPVKSAREGQANSPQP